MNRRCSCSVWRVRQVLERGRRRRRPAVVWRVGLRAGAAAAGWAPGFRRRRRRWADPAPFHHQAAQAAQVLVHALPLSGHRERHSRHNAKSTITDLKNGHSNASDSPHRCCVISVAVSERENWTSPFFKGCRAHVFLKSAHSYRKSGPPFLVVPLALESLPSKRRLNRFIRFCRIHSCT